MKAPAFWWQPPGLAANLLSPASLIYGAVAGHRMRQGGRGAALPVLCVGNVTVGGSGKTPAAIAIAAALRALGRKPVFLTRGHGGSLAGPVLVDLERHGFAEIGDEAPLLARHATTIVARDRPAGAALAATGEADAIVMDDGLQNPSLTKDLTFAIFDGAVGIGNGRVLPAGPLRAPLAAQWPRVDAVVIVGPGIQGDDVAHDAARRGLPVLRARLVPDPVVASGFAGRRVLAFAGIGRPSKLFATLEEVGAEVVRARPFPDHHAYSLSEIAALLDEAERDGLVPVTTEKDLVRIAALGAGVTRHASIRSLPVTLAFDEPERLAELLIDRLRLRGQVA